MVGHPERCYRINTVGRLMRAARWEAYQVMADQEKDRFGDKLQEAERGREEDYFARRDRELIRKMRAREPGSCPTCGALLEAQPNGTAICPRCRD
jgi:hypothetical protein